MTVQEFYEKAEGDYQGTLGRLLKEDRMVKYLKMLPQSQDYSDLLDNLEKKNYGDAFRNVHTLKGMALNLGLSKLARVSSNLTEELRQGPPTIDITQMTEDVKRVYGETVELIKEL